MNDRNAFGHTPLILDAGAVVAGQLGGPLSLRGDLFHPVGEVPDILLACLPGGGMNRRYFDLPTPPGEAEASFARAMASHGLAVALIDPPGIGESDVPPDPHLLSPAMSAQAIAFAVAMLMDMLRSGAMPGLPAWPALRSIGVGHSYGGALTVAMQAQAPLHAALALFGFGVAPIAGLSVPEEATLPLEEARVGIVAAARRRFPSAYLAAPLPRGPRTEMLRPAQDRLLATAAFATILPNCFAADAAAVRVPLLLALGDRDMHGPPHEAVRAYPGSADVTLLVLPETRHNHFAYPSRTALFARVAGWARAR